MGMESVIKALRDTGQSASNAVASNVAGPVDLLALGLRKLGVPGQEKPFMGSQWMAERGLTRDVEMGVPRIIGETLGMAGPAVMASKAPQIASAANRAVTNAMAPRTMNPQTGAIVWHGSPHKFDKFDSSKIGTGEGAQAYGHGLYLAESDKVAKSYIPANETGKAAIARQLQDEIKRAARYSNEGGQEVFEMFNKGYTPQAIRNNIDNILADGGVHPAYAKKMNKAYEKGMQIYQQNPAGSLYKVDLPDDQIAKMLDWDKPLSQQAPEVRAAIEKTRGLLPPNAMDDLGGDLSLLYGPDVKADDFLGTMNSLQPNLGETLLRQQGIPGVRYLDGGSRGTGAGTSNFVVFPGNEDILKILERNGQPLGLMGVK